MLHPSFLAPFGVYDKAFYFAFDRIKEVGYQQLENLHNHKLTHGPFCYTRVFISLHYKLIFDQHQTNNMFKKTIQGSSLFFSHCIHQCVRLGTNFPWMWTPFKGLLLANELLHTQGGNQISILAKVYEWVDHSTNPSWFEKLSFL